MRFKYCPDCGRKVIYKEIGDEGEIPYCESCKRPLFDMFSSCVIALVTDGKDDVVLLRQNYISTDYYNLVSGYIKPKETAEECARREVEEEIGLKVDEAFWIDAKTALGKVHPKGSVSYYLIDEYLKTQAK